VSEHSRIVLVEDHAILREGLRALLELEPDFEVVGEASNGWKACGSRRAPSLRSSSRTSLFPAGRDCARSMSCGWLVQRFVCCSHGYCTDEYIRAALAAGADGYVLKDASRAELLHAVRTVIAGQKYFSQPVSARLVSGYLHRDDPRSNGSWPKVTDREREVLTRVALGESNKRICSVPAFEHQDRREHRANLMRKARAAQHGGGHAGSPCATASCRTTPMRPRAEGKPETGRR